MGLIKEELSGKYLMVICVIDFIQEEYMLLIIGVVSGIVYLVTRDICYDMGVTGYWMLPNSHVGLIF